MRMGQGTVAISNGKIVDGKGQAPIENGLLLIRDGRIAFVGNAEQAPPLPPDTTRVDARGGTIMPGLVEAHFHATYFKIGRAHV